MIGAMSLHWTRIDTVWASGTLKATDFAGFCLFYIAFLAVMRLPPERLQIPFICTTVGFGATIIGLLAWSTSTVGNAGPYFHGVVEAEHGNLGWSTMFGLMAIVGNFSPAK